MKPVNEQIDELIPVWTERVAELIPDIGDDYRASDDPSDTEPSMQLTIGFTRADEDSDASWSFQTGDNSYSGGAYFHPDWAVVSLYRDSDPAEVAADIADQLVELVQDRKPADDTNMKKMIVLDSQVAESGKYPTWLFGPFDDGVAAETWANQNLERGEWVLGSMMAPAPLNINKRLP